MVKIPSTKVLWWTIYDVPCSLRWKVIPKWNLETPTQLKVVGAWKGTQEVNENSIIIGIDQTSCSLALSNSMEETYTLYYRHVLFLHLFKSHPLWSSLDRQRLILVTIQFKIPTTFTNPFRIIKINSSQDYKYEQDHSFTFGGHMLGVKNNRKREPSSRL